MALLGPRKSPKRAISWMLIWYKKLLKFITRQPQMLYESYNDYVSSRDLQFGKRLRCNSQGVKGRKLKISENEAENIFFRFILMNFQTSKTVSYAMFFTLQCISGKNFVQIGPHLGEKSLKDRQKQAQNDCLQGF